MGISEIDIVTGRPVPEKADDKPPADETPPSPPPQKSSNGLPDGYNVVQKGSWFTITAPDGTESRCQGKLAYQNLVARLSAD